VAVAAALRDYSSHTPQRGSCKSRTMFDLECRHSERHLSDLLGSRVAFIGRVPQSSGAIEQHAQIANALVPAKLNGRTVEGVAAAHGPILPNGPPPNLPTMSVFRLEWRSDLDTIRLRWNP
jgi:hypothetical protein